MVSNSKARRLITSRTSPITLRDVKTKISLTFMAREVGRIITNLATAIKSPSPLRLRASRRPKPPAPLRCTTDIYNWCRTLVCRLEETSHGPANYYKTHTQALKRQTLDPHRKVPIGIFYATEDKPTYGEAARWRLNKPKASATRRDVEGVSMAI